MISKSEKKHNRLQERVANILRDSDRYESVITNAEYELGEVDIWARSYVNGKYHEHIYEVKINPGKKKKAKEQLDRAQNYFQPYSDNEIKKIFISEKHNGDIYARRIR